MELLMGKHSLPIWYRGIRFATLVLNMMIMTGLLYSESNDQAVFENKIRKLEEIHTKNEKSLVKKTSFL